MIRRRVERIALGAALCMAACGGDVPVEPPEIRLGVDVCDGCRMAIADLRYAAAAIVVEGSERRVLRFDDIGCLARWESTSFDSAVIARWVRDRSRFTWIDADTAEFTRDGELGTPMGSGLAAFAGASDADAFAKERGGERLTWHEVIDRTRDGAAHR